jgi:ATP-binding cassette subfamily F protein 3
MAYILEANNITKYYGSNLIFKQVNLSLDRNEKAGLIGANGVGKTTLMNCLMQREPVDEGSIRVERLSSIGYLEQVPVFDDKTTLLSLVLEVFADIFEQRNRLAELEVGMSQAQGEELNKLLHQYGALRESYERCGGFACEAQTRKVLYGLGFKEDDFHRPFASFSGGEKTRISLARMLVREHDILFLDEPTNHLDLDSIEWLENYLKSYRGALLIISHDRYFLDQVTNVTFNMAGQSLKRYAGNYSTFIKQKEAEDEALRRAYEKQQEEIERTQEYIIRNKAGIKSKQARGRETRLAKLERIERPIDKPHFSMGQAVINTRTGDKVLYIDKVSYGYPQRPLFNELEQEIRYQERVALLGPNGMGKTTLLKLIIGQLEPQKGKIRYGSRVKVAYFDQEHSNLNQDNTVLEEIISQYDLTLEEAKSHLARFQFRDDDLAKTVGQLSGGEQGRLSLLKLTLDKGNFLILDEPTNHLDIYSRETMEAYLKDYPGTILMVSHDRYFVDAVADRILELDNGQLTSYLGNYTDYRRKKQELQKKLEQEVEAQQRLDAKEQDSAKKTARTNQASSVKNRSQERARKAKLREQLQLLEQEIESLENTLHEVTAQLADPNTYQSEDPQYQQSLTTKLQESEDRLPQAYAEWEEVGRQLEEADLS